MLGALLFALSLAATSTERTIEAQKGARLEVQTIAGGVVINTWTRNEVRVSAQHEEWQRIEIRQGAHTITVRDTPLGRVEYVISVPKWMAVGVRGARGAVSIEGTLADVTVQTVMGRISVRGGSGFVSLKSVQGGISLANTSARAELRTVNNSIRIADHTGGIVAETINGSIVANRVDSTDVDFSTINGRLYFEGSLREKGLYRLTSHTGGVSMAIPKDSDATIQARSYRGQIRSRLSFAADEAGDPRRRTFTIGRGGARVELESFNGTISLQEPGEPVDDERRPRQRRQRNR